METEIKSLKISLVGEPGTGKKTLAHNFTDKDFFVYDHIYKCKLCGVSHRVNHLVEGELYNLNIYDTPGGYDNDRMRSMCYPNTSCFVLCYSISSRNSFETVEERYIHELNYLMPDIPVILVATKIDLRNNSPTENLVTTEEGQKMCKRIGADKFVECSATNEESVNELFTEVVKCANSPRSKKKTKKKRCSIL